jgi:hypothetical protein
MRSYGKLKLLVLQFLNLHARQRGAAIQVILPIPTVRVGDSVESGLAS